MDDTAFGNLPATLSELEAATREQGFSMQSDRQTGSLLAVLAGSKPSGRLLELGTGTGIGTAWLLEGMDEDAQLVSVENNPDLQRIAKTVLGEDRRVEFRLEDAESYLQQRDGEQFDFIFADTWHGKYYNLELALGMLNPGALYVVDDMTPQPDWPEGHEAMARALIRKLENDTRLSIAKLNWSTGLVICSRIA